MAADGRTTTANGNEQQDASDQSYEVLYDYVAKEDDELTLIKGSTIHVLSKDYQMSGDEGWWTGLCGGKTGVFPSDYVARVDQTSVDRRTDPVSAMPTIRYSDVDLRECIGAGGFGKVCRAYYNNHEVAIKEAHIDDHDLDAIRDTVIREANLCWMFKHPNIIKLIGVCLDRPHYCLIMEYAKGGSLGRLLNAHKFVLPPIILIKWAMQVAYGMHYLHEQAKIIHRDLKSGNILLSEEVRNSNNDDLSRITLKLTDFGLAREFQCTANMTNAGTYSWMSPEVIKNSSYSKASDVWSFGVLLWELLTNEIPYKGIEPHRVQYGVAMNKLQLPIPESCPQIFSDLIQSCWNVDPHKRLTFNQIITRLIEISNSSFASTESDSFQSLQEDWKLEIYTKFKEKEEQIRNREEELERIETKNREMGEALLQKQRELDEREKDLVARELTLVLKQLNPPEPKKRRHFLRNFLRSSHMKTADISTPSGFHHYVAVKSDLQDPVWQQNQPQQQHQQIGNGSPNLRFRVICPEMRNTETPKTSSKSNNSHLKGNRMRSRDKSNDIVLVNQSQKANTYGHHMSRKATNKSPKSTTVWYHNDYLRSNSLDCCVTLDVKHNEKSPTIDLDTIGPEDHQTTKKTGISDIGSFLSLFGLGNKTPKSHVKVNSPRLQTKTDGPEQCATIESDKSRVPSQSASLTRLTRSYPRRFKMKETHKAKQRQQSLSHQIESGGPTSRCGFFDSDSDTTTNSGSAISNLIVKTRAESLKTSPNANKIVDTVDNSDPLSTPIEKKNINRPMTLNLMLKTEVEKSHTSYLNKQNKRKDLLSSSNEDDEMTSVDKQMKYLLKTQDDQHYSNSDSQMKKLNSLNTPLMMTTTRTSMQHSLITPMSSEDLFFNTNDFLVTNDTVVLNTPNNTPPSRDSKSKSSAQDQPT